MTKFKRAISLSLTPEENKLVEEIKKSGVTIIDVFRRGIKECYREMTAEKKVDK